jgi:hypothetical protein
MVSEEKSGSSYGENIVNRRLPEGTPAWNCQPIAKSCGHSFAFALRSLVLSLPENTDKAVGK